MEKILPCKPGRSCLKITGDPMLSKIIIATINIGIQNIINNNEDIIKSNNRFKIYSSSSLFYMLIGISYHTFFHLILNLFSNLQIKICSKYFHKRIFTYQTSY